MWIRTGTPAGRDGRGSDCTTGGHSAINILRQAVAVTVKNERGQVLNALEERYYTPRAMHHTDSAPFRNARKSAGRSSVPQNPHLFLLPLVGLTPNTERNQSEKVSDEHPA